MTVDHQPPTILSPSDLDRLRSAVNRLPNAQDPFEDVIRFGTLLAEERSKWPDLFNERQRAPGEVIYKENAPGDTMDIIQSGRVVAIRGEFSTPIVLGCRYPGESIGEMALLEGSTRSASVVALEPVCLLEINRDNFLKLLGASPTFSLGIMRMLSARLREATEAVQRETLDKIRDPLTGLYNRRYMEVTLEHELQRAHRAGYPVSLILLDIDHFKNLNDTFGHPAGDQVLRSLGVMIQSQVRRADVACRYGGEEFLIILPETPVEVAFSRAEELRAAFSKLAVNYNGRIMKSTLSLGIAAYPEHGRISSGIIQSADNALYKAKTGGRNRVALAEK